MFHSAVCALTGAADSRSRRRATMYEPVIHVSPRPAQGTTTLIIGHPLEKGRTCTCALCPLPSRPLLLLSSFSSFITTEGEAYDVPPAATRLWGHPRER